MEQGLIGVIVPVYNVEKYIAKCIESILAQTYTKFRLILVDDGSPDNAGKICDEYASKDPRITVIHQDNAGVTRARAKGVEEANDCEFIMFVDGDDMIPPKALEEYYRIIDKETDIVLCISYTTEEQHCVFIDNWENLGHTMPIDNFRKRVLNVKGGMPWGRLFRKSIINDIVFDIPRGIYFGEDAIMNLRIAFRTEKEIKTIREPLYFYRKHATSVCSQFGYSAEYLSKLCHHLKESIPTKKMDEYMLSHIKCRADLWRVLLSYRIRIDDWAGTDFHRELKQDIKTYGYRLPISERLLLKYTNPIIRFFIITIRKAKNLLYKTLNLTVAPRA